jgi:hypothetical protein
MNCVDVIVKWDGAPVQAFGADDRHVGPKAAEWGHGSHP